MNASPIEIAHNSGFKATYSTAVPDFTSSDSVTAFTFLGIRNGELFFSRRPSNIFLAIYGPVLQIPEV
jgi:hypothetical protein